MKILCVLFVLFIVGAAPSAAPGAESADETPAGAISSDLLLDAIADELTRVLDSERRFEPLPPVLSGLFISPEHSPCFAFRRRTYEIPSLTRTRQELWDVHHKKFHLLENKNVVGWGEEDEIVVTADRGRGVSIRKRDGSRMAEIDRDRRVDQAFYFHDWIFRSDKGFVKEGRHPAWPGSEKLLSHCVVIDSGNTFAVVHPPKRNISQFGEPLPVEICVGRNGTWDCRTFEHLPYDYRDRIKGILVRDDNGLLALGRKLVTLSADLKPTPSEKDLAALLDAVEKGDRKRIERGLQDLTVYSSDHLSGLITLLEKIPDTFRQELAHYWSVKKSFDTVLRRKEPETEREEETGRPAKGESVLDRYVGKMETILREYHDALEKEFAYSPGLIAMMLRSGMQFYEGCWIGTPEVILQPNPSEAFLWIGYRDPFEKDPRWGLFRLNERGTLSPLHPADTRRSGAMNVAPTDAVEDREGRILFFFKGRGLAEFDGSRFAWIDRGERIKRMSALIGCDSSGRIYFAQERIRATKLYWIYQRNGTLGELIDSSAIVVGSPDKRWTFVRDDIGNVWYVSPVTEMDFRSPPPFGNPPPREKPYFSNFTVQEKELVVRHVGTSAEEEKETERSQVTPRLCYIDKEGQHWVCFRDKCLSRCTLLPGRNGSLLVVSDSKTILIHDRTAYVAENLHQLAEKEFRIAAEYAPRESPQFPLRGLSRDVPPVACFLVDDVLWITQGGRIEAYRWGESLSIQKRITLLVGEHRSPCLVGPFGPGKQRRLFIILDPDHYTGNLWATQSHEGIELTRSMKPGINEHTLSKRAAFSGYPPPFFDFKRGRIFCPSAVDALTGVAGGGRLMEISGPDKYTILPTRGIPRLAFPDGRLLVERSDRFCRHFCLVAGQSMENILLTVKKPLEPVALCDDETILCLSPQGVAWIGSDGKGDYEIRRQLDARMPGTPLLFVGQTEKMIHVLTDQNYLASIPIE